jgi:hypothetical protein
VQWFRAIPSIATWAGFPGPFVPQKMYRPPTSSGDRVRYVDQVVLEDPIIFLSSNPEEYGIPLINALRSDIKRLNRR